MGRWVNMKVLVTGVTGQLGYDVCRALEREQVEYLGVSSQDFDLGNRSAASAFVEHYCPDAVIHCAAYTKVDLAEDERDRCMEINARGSEYLAEACRRIGAKLLLISSDYVFPGSGDDFYEVDSPLCPINVYGRSKAEAEQAVRTILPEHFVVRISWVFGKNGGNFIKTMLRLGRSQNEVRVVDDQIGSPTYTADLAPLLCQMIATEQYGTYHATNEGVCSWAELAETVFQLSEIPICVTHIATGEFPAKARRPLNSRLSKRSLDAAGFKRLPGWKDAVQRYLEELRREVEP